MSSKSGYEVVVETSAKLVGTSSAWRIRVGDRRVIYEIDDTQRQVRVMMVKPRDRVYD